MLYKFKSKAGADVIMLEAHATQVLGWLGRDPKQPGIVEHDKLAHAIAAIEAALQAIDAEPALAEAEADADAIGKPCGVSMRQRCWPLLTLMRQSLAEQADLVWRV